MEFNTQATDFSEIKFNETTIKENLKKDPDSGKLETKNPFSSAPETRWHIEDRGTGLQQK